MDAYVVVYRTTGRPPTLYVPRPATAPAFKYLNVPTREDQLVEDAVVGDAPHAPLSGPKLLPREHVSAPVTVPGVGRRRCCRRCRARPHLPASRSRCAPVLVRAARPHR